MPSTLSYAPTVPMAGRGDDRFPDERYVVVGMDANGYFLHGQPRAPIPKDARVLMDGTKPWTWNQVATRFALDAVELTPHEWAGEPSARELVVTPFTKEAARRARQLDAVVRER